MFGKTARLDHKTEMALRSFEYRNNYRKYGCNNDLDAGVREDVWEFGGSYIFTSGLIGNPADAVPYYISSSSNLDLQRTQHFGIGPDGFYQSHFINLQGQTKLRLGDTLNWFRYNRGVNRDNVNQLQFAGNVYIYEDTTVTNGIPNDITKIRGFIPAGKDQTQQAIYTTAIDETESFENISIDLTSRIAASVTFEVFVRVRGEVWTVQKTKALNSTGTGALQEFAFPPLTVFPGTDIVIKATSGANNVGVCAEWGLEKRKTA